MKTTVVLAITSALGCFLLCFVTAPGEAQQKDEPASAPATGGAETGRQAAADEAAESKDGSFWMDQKLRLAKELLTGLANGDFEAIGKSAEVMKGVNRVESFVRRGPKGYRDYLRQFNMANEALIRYSLEENLEGATLAFNQLTVSCVNCHEHLRQAE